MYSNQGIILEFQLFPKRCKVVPMTRPLSEALLRVRIPQELKDACEEKAQELRMTLSEFVRDAMQARLTADSPTKNGGGLNLESLLQEAGERGIYEVVLRTQPRRQPSKRASPGGK
jgi:hypothetical protein